MRLKHCLGKDEILAVAEDADAMIIRSDIWDFPAVESTATPEFKCVLQLVKDAGYLGTTEWKRMAKRCMGVVEETTTVVFKLEEMVA